MSSNALDLIFGENITNTDDIWCYGCFCKPWFLGEKGNIILRKKKKYVEPYCRSIYETVHH